MKLDAKQMMNRLRVYKESDFPKVVMKQCRETFLRHLKPKNIPFFFIYFSL